MPAIAPSNVEATTPNEYYPTPEAYVFAIAEAMREEYRAIVDAYSDQRVACVSMMETYRARSAIRDVAASLGLPPHEIDAVLDDLVAIVGERGGRLKAGRPEVLRLTKELLAP